MTAGRDRRVYKEFDKSAADLESFDRMPRQRPLHKATRPDSYEDDRCTFTEEQMQKETQRCLGCGAVQLNQEMCIGCGQCLSLIHIFAGVCVTETESLQEGQEFPLTGEGEFAGVQGEGGIFRDMLEVSDAQVLMRYGDRFYHEFAAVTRKARKSGFVYYLGCGLDEALLARVLEQAAAEQGITPEPSAPGVELVYRGSGKDRIRMVINHNPCETPFNGTVLAPFECRIDSAAQPE